MLKSAKRILALALVISVMGLSSCTAEIDDGSSCEPSSSAVPGNAVPVISETTTAAVTTTTAPPATTTTAATTTTVITKPDPVPIDDTLLSGHRFFADSFPEQVYSNEDLQAAFDEIDSICNDYGYNISFAYKNIDTGAVCYYNREASYGICSTIKAPFVKYLLADGVDVSEIIKINQKWELDYGTVAEAGIGSEFTSKDLMTYAITESDNTAYLNLVRHYGYAGFNKQNDEMGVRYWLGSDWIFTYCNVSDLLKQYEDIYYYTVTEKRGEWLKRQMMNTDVETQITAQLGDKYDVAHKYGSDSDQKCYHDCAICYADSPFVLIIMTHQMPETEESDKVFHRLAEQFDIVNEQLAM